MWKTAHLRYLESEDAFWDRVFIPKDRTACWYWTMGRLPFGYAMFRGVMVHRYSWGIRNGMMPHISLDVCHDCDNPPCVNPDHLTLGTHMDNMADCSKRNRRTMKRLDSRISSPCSICEKKSFYPIPVDGSFIGVSCGCFLRLSSRGEIISGAVPTSTWNRTAPPRPLWDLRIKATAAAMEFLLRRPSQIKGLCNPADYRP